LLRARDVWYGRIQDTDHADLNLWVDVGLQACVRRANASDRRWGEVLDGHVPEKLDQPIAYTNSKGHSFRTTLKDVLVHVLNHGMHHRGQITLMLRESHPQPPIILSFFGSNNAMFWADHTHEQPWTGE